MGEDILLDPDMIKEIRYVIETTHDKMQAAQSCYKSYAEKRLRSLEFIVNDFDVSGFTYERGGSFC